MTLRERGAEAGEGFARRHPDSTRVLLAIAVVAAVALIAWKLTDWVESSFDALALAVGLLLGVVICSFWWVAARRHYDVGPNARLALTASSLLGGLLVFEVAYGVVGGAARVASAGCLAVMALWLLPTLVLARRLQRNDPAEAERTLERSREIFPQP